MGLSEICKEAIAPISAEVAYENVDSGREHRRILTANLTAKPMDNGSIPWTLWSVSVLQQVQYGLP